MLDYIKNQIKSRMPVENKSVEPSTEDIPNDVIVEYAHLFQELDDISIEGSEVDKARKMSIDIPFEDEDIEIESIEFNLGDGRVTDVPGDATVQEEYSYMKTYSQFYQEAAESMTRMPRESDAMFDRRVSDVATKNYEEYCARAAEDGLFGFDDLSIGDSRVPSKLNIDFGPISEDSDKSFFTKVKTFFATDNDHNISKKQLDSVNLVRNGAFSKIGKPLMAYMESKYDVPTGASVWDVATPMNLYVPRGNGDSFCVVLEYMNELTNKKEYFGWTRPVKSHGSIENVITESATPEQDYLDSIRGQRFTDEMQQLEIALNAKLPKDFAEGVSVFDTLNFSNANITKDGNVIFVVQEMWPLKRILSECSGNNNYLKDNTLFAIGDDGYGNYIVMRTTDWTYHVWYHDQFENGKNKMVMIAKAFSAEGIDPGYGITKENTLLYMLGNTTQSTYKASPTSPVLPNTTQESFVDDMERVNMESFVNETHYENRDTFIQEAEMREELASRRHYSRFYQEAIDFGGADGGSDLPPAEGEDTSSDDAPADTTPDTSNDDATVDTGNASDAPESNDDSTDKETAAVNDVSKEIAEKVSEKTQDDMGDDSTTPSDDSTDITFDDDDTASTDDGSASVDDQLDDLDNSMGDTESSDDVDDDMPSDDTSGDIDFDNLTIDQLIEQGSEKLKGMTLQEIKEFLSSGSEEAVQEAFILTKKNINKELDIELRKCLGILNDNQMDLDKLLKKFKFAGKKLNRVLTKAAKINEVYSTDEVQSIQKLNKVLVDLLASLKNSKDSSYVSKIKNLIREFVSQSKVVGSFVEDKLKGGTSAAIQEGFVQEGLFLSEKNAKKRLAVKIPPVHADMMSIIKAHDEGKLTKGKLSKMYKPKTSTSTVTDTYGSDEDTFRTSRTSTETYEISTPQMDNIDSLAKIISKILRKTKVQRAFASDEISKIDELADKLDDFVDFIESLIYDSTYKDSLLKQVVKDAKKIVELLDEIYQFSSDSDEPLSSTKRETPEDLPVEEPSEDTTTDTDDETTDIESETPEFDDNDSSEDSSDDDEKDDEEKDKEEDDE